MNNTWNKAWVGGLAAPIVDWLLGIGANALTSCCEIATPGAVQGALSALIVGALIYYVPNKQA